MTVEVHLSHEVVRGDRTRSVRLMRIGRDRWFLRSEYSPGNGPGIISSVEVTAEELGRLYAVLAEVFARGRCIVCARESGDIASAFCPEHRTRYEATDQGAEEDTHGET